ncbi:MAG: DUF6029 family protein [Bacteroidales bacterium]|jgi:hypothetical protein|nr:DUF6029 family protein [Bacteroidales bacterium]
MKNILKLILAAFLLTISLQGYAQSQIGRGRISGDFGFNGMYYIPDSLIGAKKVDEKVRANTWLNLNYTNGGFTAGVRYEFYSFPLIDFENIGYKGQGLTNYFVDYKNDFIQVTAGSFYEQFGNGLVFRAYEDRQLGIDNSLLGARVKVTPYKGITLKGIWGIERNNFDFNYTERQDYVRGLDADIALADFIPKMAEKGFTTTIGGSFVSKYEKSENDMYLTYQLNDTTTINGIIAADKFPQNVATWAARLNFGYKGFRLETEYAHKINDPNKTNQYIYKDGEALYVSATYSMKGLGISASFIRSDNMDFRSRRNTSATTSLLSINNVPAINRQYSYALLGNYSYASQPNGQIGAQAQINYQIPKKSKLGGKYGVDIALNYSRFHDLAKQLVPTADSIGTVTGTEGYTSNFFKCGDNLLYQDVGVEIGHRFDKRWKLDLAYNFITYNTEILQGHEGNLFKGHNVMAKVSCKINAKHALKMEIDHLYAKEDNGSWLYGLIEYSISPKWFISVSDQWNYGNNESALRIHYYNIAAAFVIKTTRIALNFGKTKEGILCIGGVCRTVPASYGLGLSVTTSF